jgi:hypothetical protein
MTICPDGQLRTTARGKPTVHVQYDDATAILAGDALLTIAFEIHRDPRGTPQIPKCVQPVAALSRASGANVMVGGQMLDQIAETTSLDNGAISASRHEDRELLLELKWAHFWQASPAILPRFAPKRMIGVGFPDHRRSSGRRGHRRRTGTPTAVTTGRQGDVCDDLGLDAPAVSDFAFEQPCSIFGFDARQP